MKNIKTIISLVLAVVLVATALPVMALGAEKGDVNGDGKITAVDARIILQIVAKVANDEVVKNPDAADFDGNGNVTATDARRVLQRVANIDVENPTPDNPVNDTKKAELAAVFNAETSKASKGAYTWTRKCEFSQPLDAGSATDTLNSIISKIDASASLDSVVGSFLNVGNTNGTQDDAGNFALVAMSLTEADIKEFDEIVGQTTLVLYDSHNPTGDGKTPFEHISNDVITKDNVAKEIEKQVGTMITLNKLDTKYHEVKIVAKLENRVPVSLTISYKLSASLGLKAVSLDVNGTGEIYTEITYTNFNY